VKKKEATQTGEGGQSPIAKTAKKKNQKNNKNGACPKTDMKQAKKGMKMSRVVVGWVEGVKLTQLKKSFLAKEPKRGLAR